MKRGCIEAGWWRSRATYIRLRANAFFVISYESGLWRDQGASTVHFCCVVSTIQDKDLLVSRKIDPVTSFRGSQ